jgi:lipopolysaccharide/colanic/teichoic acid biosynthesis glycosyltransferase
MRSFLTSWLLITALSLQPVTLAVAADKGDFTAGFDKFGEEPSKGCLTSAFGTITRIIFSGQDPLAIAERRTLSNRQLEVLDDTPVEEISLDVLRDTGTRQTNIEKTVTDRVIRALDLAYSTVALPFAVPLVGLFALMIRMDSKGPIFYIAQRVGQDGKPISVWKLRTMRPDADKIGGSTAAGDSRIAGRWAAKARRYKVDELPQLLNVLQGTLSIVGSRPLDLREVNQIEKVIPGFTQLRHEHKPGLANIPQAVMDHSGDIKTADGVSQRKDKFHAEVRADLEAEQNPVIEYHKTIALVIKGILNGTGSR